MKQQVLKALANPARIFYVPYTLAVINFALQFIIFIAIFIVGLTVGGLTGIAGEINPLYFLLSVIGVHILLAGISKTEPQLGQIISAKIQLFRARIPKRLIS